ncbi:MAG: hypothetical protein LBK06_01410 [Planctomycetaceae bacterium]|jgi:hypothetical protein|nr:hypothetical protein [Planctomycetaceae bacterium]
MQITLTIPEEFCCDPYFIPGFHNPQTFRKGTINGDIVNTNCEEFENWEKNQDWWTNKPIGLFRFEDQF